MNRDERLRHIERLREMASELPYAPPHDWRSARHECMIECAKKELEALELEDDQS